MKRPTRRATFLFWFSSTLLVWAAPALDAISADGDMGPAGHLSGHVVDANTGESIGWAQIQVKEAHRSTQSDENGLFRISNIAEGGYTLSTFRIGYQQALIHIHIRANDTLRLTVRLADAPLGGEAVIVEGSRESEKRNVVVEMSDRKLRQHLGKTVAETVAGEAGMDQRTMGPAPARPVLRGLSGDRLLVLEDGGRTGDLSATSTDHAVVIDPITTDRIEVIRGPAALLYGSNTLGGVVNVERGYIPSALPDRRHVTWTAQGESVNNGVSTGLVVSAPFRNLAWRLDGSWRHAGDIRTPDGRLNNTGIETANGSAGFSYLKDWGYVGLAGSYYRSEYGVPGGFVGAHPNGVRIKLDRKHFEGRADFHFEDGPFERSELKYSFSKYFHQEFESNGSIGTQFSVLNYDLNWQTKIRPFSEFGEGEMGVWAEYRDYVPGGFIFTPDTKEFTTAVSAYEQADMGRWRFEGAVRTDYRVVDPAITGPAEIGLIRRRTFVIFSASGSVARSFGRNWKSGIKIMRSGRAPGIEELYSEGPHLAAYSFEVGNPSLKSEQGWGLEWFGQWQRGGRRFEIALFRNDIDRYIFPRNSGRIHIATQLPVYQYAGLHAVMTGGEITLEHKLPWSMSVAGTFSYVRGTLADSNQALPAMPPWNTRLELKKQVGAFATSVQLRAAGRQDRVAPLEEPTDGYAVFDASTQYYRQSGNFLHTIVLSVENIGDTAYRRHLSRVRSIMPEPGRNIKLLYKVFF